MYGIYIVKNDMISKSYEIQLYFLVSLVLFQFEWLVQIKWIILKNLRQLKYAEIFIVY